VAGSVVVVRQLRLVGGLVRLPLPRRPRPSARSLQASAAARRLGLAAGRRLGLAAAHRLGLAAAHRLGLAAAYLVSGWAAA
jgi:hypothetical protein